MGTDILWIIVMVICFKVGLITLGWCMAATLIFGILLTLMK